MCTETIFCQHHGLFELTVSPGYNFIEFLSPLFIQSYKPEMAKVFVANFSPLIHTFSWNLTLFSRKLLLLLFAKALYFLFGC